MKLCCLRACYIVEVVVIRPIPKNLLIHSVKLEKRIKDEWGNTTVQEETTMKHVRMEPSNKIIRDKNNAEIKLNATLFIDVVHSKIGKEVEIEIDDLISFNGDQYRVQEVERLYDERKLHHCELGLVRYL